VSALVLLVGLLAGGLACGVSDAPPDLTLSGDCEGPYPELVVTCRVQAAADAGRRGDPGAAEAACEQVPEGTLWREECHFRAGESFAQAGALMPALSHCRRAGAYARNCLTHAAWNLKLSPTPSPDDPGAGVQLAALDAAIAEQLAGAPPSLMGAAREELISRAWFLVYFGSGSADPAAVNAAPPAQLPYARTAFALEAARLLGRGSRPLEQLPALLAGDTPAPTGAPLPVEHRVGRHSPPPIPPEARERTMVVTFGGSKRLSSPDADEDLYLAGLAALFFLDAREGAFLPSTEDERVLVRDQAIAYAVAVAREPDTVAEPFLSHMDPVARAYAREALKVRRDQDRRRK